MLARRVYSHILGARVIAMGIRDDLLRMWWCGNYLEYYRYNLDGKSVESHRRSHRSPWNTTVPNIMPILFIVAR